MLVQLISNINMVRRTREYAYSNMVYAYPSITKTLFLFSPKNKARILSQKIINFHISSQSEAQETTNSFMSKITDILSSYTVLNWIVLLSTQVSCISMLFETAKLTVFDKSWTAYVEYYYFAVTFIEIVLKTIADGWLFCPHAFLPTVDGAVALFNNLILLINRVYFYRINPSNMLINYTNKDSFGVLIRILRCFRPIRLITISPNLNSIVKMVVDGWKNILKVTAILLVFVNFYAYYSFSIFNTKLEVCTNSAITNLSQCTGTFKNTIPTADIFGNKNPALLNGEYPDIMVPQARYIPQLANYGSLQESILSAFFLITLESWNNLLDLTSAKISDWTSIYIFIYVFVSNVIAISMFIGVIVQTFNEKIGIALLTAPQKRWEDLKKRILLTNPILIPQMPNNYFRALIYRKTNSIGFRILESLTLFAIIVLNMIFPPFDFYYKEERFYLLLASFSGFLALYIMSFFKLLSFGFKQLLHFYGYHIALVTVSAIITFLNFFYRDNISAINIIKYPTIIIFVLDFIYLCYSWPVTNSVLLTIVKSILKSMDTLLLLLIISQCYVLMGIVLFGLTRYGLLLNRYLNFRNSLNTMNILFLVAIGDGWTGLLQDASIEPPFCIPPGFEMISDCGHRVGAILYFVSYTVIVSFILLNLLIAMVLSNFSLFVVSTKGAGHMIPSDISYFQTLWMEMDPKATGYVSTIKAEMIIKSYFDARFIGIITTRHFKYLTMIKEIYTTVYGTEYALYKTGSPKSTKDLISFHKLLFILAFHSVSPTKNMKDIERIDRIKLENQILESVAINCIYQWLKKLKSFSKGIITVSVDMDSDDELVPQIPLENDIFKNYDGIKISGARSHREITDRSGRKLLFDSEEVLSDEFALSMLKTYRLTEAYKSDFMKWFTKEMSSY